jgi:hypothetical protein
MEDLKRAKNVNEQKSKMAAFASEVLEEYQRLFADHNAELTPTERGRRDDILRLLIAARTLFTVEQVSEGLALDDITQSLDKEEIDFEPAEEITKLCQPFVKVPDHHHVVIHDSDREFPPQHRLTKREPNQPPTWTKFLSAPIKVEIPIKDFYETAHMHLSRILEERSQDKLLPYLPQIGNAEYFNSAGRSTQDRQTACDNKKSIAMEFAEILGLVQRSIALKSAYVKPSPITAHHLPMKDLQKLNPA